MDLKLTLTLTNWTYAKKFLRSKNGLKLNNFLENVMFAGNLGNFEEEMVKMKIEKEFNHHLRGHQRYYHRRC